MNETHKNTETGRGKVLSAKRLIVPFTAAILLMQVLILLNTVHIRNLNAYIAEATQRNFAITAASNGLSRATDEMTGTATRYVGGDTEALSDYLSAFGEMEGNYSALRELIALPPTDAATIHPQAQATEDDPVQILEQARAAVAGRYETERTAMTLAAQARGEDLSDDPILTGALPPELAALPPEAMLGRAQGMIHDSAYQSTRGDVQRNLAMASAMASAQNEAAIRRLSDRMEASQVRQWTLMGLIMAVMIVMSTLLFKRLLDPLEESAALVQQGAPLPVDRGFSEIRRLSASYDELLAHREKLEAELRRQSHTDALTGLPNRLAYEDRIAALDAAEPDDTLIMFSMDVNGLKETNDTQGHQRGDVLLCQAADCLRASFGGEAGASVYRFGGDEFAAIWQGRSEKQAHDALERFREEQDRRGISISVGYARLADNPGLTAQHLFDKADQSMYKAKTAFKHGEETA